MALVKMTQSMSGVMFSFFWPIITGIPLSSRCFTVGDLARSEPVTSKPRLFRISASPLIEMPPMPQKKTFFGCVRSNSNMVICLPSK